MKKSGFTLAEILITMSIIGVVAALTAPALIQDASNAKVGPALEKTKSAIELANQNILFQNRAGDLLAVRVNGDPIDQAGYLQLLAQNFQNSTFIPAPVAGGGQTIGTFEFRDRAGDIQSGTRTWAGQRVGNQDPNNTTPKLVLADNVTISVNADQSLYANFDGNTNGDLGRNGSYRGPLANLLIDLNGVKNGPNVYGRDIFFFTVDRSGVVIPDGSNLFYDNTNASGYMTWNGNGAARAFVGANNYICTRDNAANMTGRGCAGAILDNNRRVDYR